MVKLVLFVNELIFLEMSNCIRIELYIEREMLIVFEILKKMVLLCFLVFCL